MIRWSWRPRGELWPSPGSSSPTPGRVVMANPMAVRAIASAKAKTDRLDARTLAKLLAAGFLPGVWLGDERTRLLRRLVSRHAQLIRQRTRAKNQIHAVLQRTLKGRPPASDLFGKRGRAWLGDQDLPADERETVQASLRHVEFLDGELRLVDRTIAEQVLSWPEVRRIMTIPGMGATAAAGVMAAITPAAAVAPIPGMVMIRRTSGQDRTCSAMVRSTRRSSPSKNSTWRRLACTVSRSSAGRSWSSSQARPRLPNRSLAGGRPFRVR